MYPWKPSNKSFFTVNVATVYSTSVSKTHVLQQPHVVFQLLISLTCVFLIESLFAVNMFLYKLLTLCCIYYQALACGQRVNVLYVLRECTMVMFADEQTLMRPDSFHEAVRHGHRGHTSRKVKSSRYMFMTTSSWRMFGYRRLATVWYQSDAYSFLLFPTGAYWQCTCLLAMGKC